MSRNFKLILILGALALVAIFVLIVFARTILQDSLDETVAKYERGPITTLGSIGETSNDPFVTKGVLTPPVREANPIKGVPRAQLTIIEFGDFQCPYCADMAEVLDGALASYPDDIRLVWKDLANPAHLEARDAALAAHCAQSQGKFWEYHDLLFANQENLGDTLYQDIAAELGLDLVDFERCLSIKAFIETVGQGFDDANNYDVDGTPYLFVGSQRIDRAVSFTELQQVIEQELGLVDK